MRWFFGCLAACLLVATLCCGLGAAGMYMAPEVMVGMATSDKPLDIPPAVVQPGAADSVLARMTTELKNTGTTTISPEEMTQLFANGDPTSRMRVTASGDKMAVDVSVRLDEGKWINVHGLGGFTMEHGWFTDLRWDEVRLSDWDLGHLFSGQQMAAQGNESLVRERARNPELDFALQGVEFAAVKDGKVVFALTEDGMARFQAWTLAGHGL